MMAHRYYLLLRPAMPGGVPKDGMVDCFNFDSRAYYHPAGREIWGWVDYSEELPFGTAMQYDLTYGGPVEEGSKF